MPSERSPQRYATYVAEAEDGGTFLAFENTALSLDMDFLNLCSTRKNRGSAKPMSVSFNGAAVRGANGVPEAKSCFKAGLKETHLTGSGVEFSNLGAPERFGGGEEDIHIGRRCGARRAAAVPDAVGARVRARGAERWKGMQTAKIF